jgi:hypothetical protein
MARIDHTACTHPRTSAGRRACRAGNIDRQDRGWTAPADTMKIFREDREIKMTGPVARRMAKHAMKAENARIQPRRSGARVSIDASGCVQAALHIDAHGGRCACGWVANKAA